MSSSNWSRYLPILSGTYSFKAIRVMWICLLDSPFPKYLSLAKRLLKKYSLFASRTSLMLFNFIEVWTSWIDKLQRHLIIGILLASPVKIKLIILVFTYRSSLTSITLWICLNTFRYMHAKYFSWIMNFASKVSSESKGNT